MRTFIGCGLATLFLGVLLSYADLRSVDSKYDVFKQIRAGMPQQELIDLFRARDVQCTPSDSYPLSTYDFSDYSRKYHVSVNTQNGKVFLVAFSFRHGSNGFRYLAGVH